MGQYQKALDCFQKALDLTQSFFGNNIEYAACERSIAMVYEALGDLNSSLEHMTSALSIIELILGTDNPRTKEYRAYAERLASKVSTL